MDKEQQVQERLKDNQETQRHRYEEFCKWWEEAASEDFRAELRSMQERYNLDIARWLRSDDPKAEMKARLAQQAKDILDIVMTKAIDDAKSKLTPHKDVDEGEFY